MQRGSVADQEEAASDVASPRNGKRAPPPRSPHKMEHRRPHRRHWLTEHGNYDKRRGGDKFSGETQAVLAAQIVARIRDVGITTPRKPKDTISKIGQLEQSYRDVTDFLNHTGAGITDERSLRHAIEKRCPHYDVLSEVLRDRPSVRPLLTNEDQAFGASDLDAAGDSDAGADTLETADQRAHSQKHSSTSTSTSYRSIRSRRASIASTSSDITMIAVRTDARGMLRLNFFVFDASQPVSCRCQLLWSHIFTPAIGQKQVRLGLAAAKSENRYC
ncbi:hypothetical protein PybrP1_004886 [[Pythium] brassicae (nom. inval.)]|nr:hypothetical protein PybrP1_004886 [[Pythium] brassicae (nom. inval.)]